MPSLNPRPLPEALKKIEKDYILQCGRDHIIHTYEFFYRSSAHYRSGPFPRPLYYFRACEKHSKNMERAIISYLDRTHE